MEDEPRSIRRLKETGRESEGMLIVPGQGRSRDSEAGRQAKGRPGSSSWPCRPVQLREFKSCWLLVLVLTSITDTLLILERVARWKTGWQTDRTGQGKAGQKISERNPKALWTLRQSRCSAAFLFSFPYP